MLLAVIQSVLRGLAKPFHIGDEAELRIYTLARTGNFCLGLRLVRDIPRMKDMAEPGIESMFDLSLEQCLDLAQVRVRDRLFGGRYCRTEVHSGRL